MDEYDLLSLGETWQEIPESIWAAVFLADSKMERLCSLCGEKKFIGEFFKTRGENRRFTCKKCESKRSSEWVKLNPDRAREYQRKSYQANPEKHLAWARRWRKNNPEKCRERQRKKDKKRRATQRGKLEGRMSTAVYLALKDKKNGRPWEILVGYTTHDLMKHLEKQFTEGMAWENMGEWHIDHIIPKSAFNYKTPEDIDFKRCWALKNLQPMWAKDNLSKNAKLEKPFQPSLAFSEGAS